MKRARPPSATATPTPAIRSAPPPPWPLAETQRLKVNENAAARGAELHAGLWR
jgi:hypothetical protein